MKKIIIIAIYFGITTFTIVGNPFATVKVATIPIFGIILTLPWSLILPHLVPPNSINSVSVVLEVGAILNAIILFFILAKKSAVNKVQP